MTIQEAQKKIKELLDKAEDQNDYGGVETEDGDLMPGYVEWKELKSKIEEIINQIQP